MAKNKKPKYRVDVSKRKRFPEPLFTKTYIVNEAEVAKFVKRNKRLPEHVYEVRDGDDGAK